MEKMTELREMSGAIKAFFGWFVMEALNSNFSQVHRQSIQFSIGVCFQRRRGTQKWSSKWYDPNLSLSS